MLVSKNKFAELHGVNAQTVQNWKRRGLLRMRNGKVDVAATDSVLAQRSPLSRRDLPLDGESSSEAAARIVVDGGNVFSSIKQAQLFRESYTAKLKQLEYGLAAGELVKIAAAKQALISDLLVIRNGVLSLGSRLAPRIVNCSDPNVVQRLIDDEVYGLLTELTTRTDAVFAEAAAKRPPGAKS